MTLTDEQARDLGLEEVALEELAIARSLGCTCYPSVGIVVVGGGLALCIEMEHDDQCGMMADE